MAKWHFRAMTVKREAVFSAREGTEHHVPGCVKESFTLRTSELYQILAWLLQVQAKSHCHFMQ